MPKGIKIDWDIYRKDWLKFQGKLSDFCKIHKLNYYTAKDNLKTKDKTKLKLKKNNTIEKVVNKEIEKQAIKEGLEIARIYTEQNEDLAKLKSLKNLFQKKIERIDKKIEGKNEIKSSELVELSLIAERLFKATKTIIEYVGQNINVNATVDERILKINMDAEQLARQYMRDIEK